MAALIGMPDALDKTWVTQLFVQQNRPKRKAKLSLKIFEVF
jgi:hypothetical protein